MDDSFHGFTASRTASQLHGFRDGPCFHRRNVCQVLMFFSIGFRLNIPLIWSSIALDDCVWSKILPKHQWSFECCVLNLVLVPELYQWPLAIRVVSNPSYGTASDMASDPDFTGLTRSVCEYLQTRIVCEYLQTRIVCEYLQTRISFVKTRIGWKVRSILKTQCFASFHSQGLTHTVRPGMRSVAKFLMECSSRGLSTQASIPLFDTVDKERLAWQAIASLLIMVHTRGVFSYQAASVSLGCLLDCLSHLASAT